jgi:hypothetical protein
MVERGNDVPLLETPRVPLTVLPPPGMAAGGLSICLAILLSLMSV